MANDAGQNGGTPNPQQLGQAMMGEISPFPSDDELPDYSADIAEAFGLEDKAGTKPKSSEGSPDGGASPSGATPAAEGGTGQAQPATPPVQQPQPGQQGEVTQAPAQQQPQAPAPAAPAAAPVQGQQPAPEAASLVALQAQIQALITQNQQLQARLGMQGALQGQPQTGSGVQPQQQGQPQQQPNPLMDYRLAMPDDVANAVFNEDPAVARAGMTHIINSLGRVVHERVIQHVDGLINERLQGFNQQLSLTQQQEQMRQQYFTKFPQHSDPGIRLIVAQEGEAMWAQNPVQQWDDNAINALGARVNARLGIGLPGQQQPQQQPAGNTAQQPTAAAPRPAAQMGASPRPPAEGQEPGQFIHDVLSA